MRIVGGRFGGRPLAAPGAAGGGAAHLRPTGDRVREAVFNLLAHGGFADPPVPEGMRVLDLFAGTGALGLEALSRGAVHATFVDDGGTARALLRDNVARCAAQGVTKVFRRDATDLGALRGAPFTLVFLDPPYGQGLGERAVASALAGGWLAPGATLVWEEEAAPLPPAAFTLLEERRYGRTTISLFRAP